MQIHKDTQTFKTQGLWEREVSETVSEEQLAVLSKGLVPVNTSPVTILYDFLSYFEFLHVFVKPI